MRLSPLLDYERKSGAVWYVLFRQSPKGLLLIGEKDHLLEAWCLCQQTGAAGAQWPVWYLGPVRPASRRDEATVSARS
jgi:hypothetical protein